MFFTGPQRLLGPSPFDDVAPRPQRAIDDLRQGRKADSATAENSYQSLEKYARDLTEAARQGKLAWDDPVSTHLPAFAMYDPYVSKEITVRDLVTHRAGLGLGQGDLMWWPPTTFTRAEIVSGIRYLPPASSFRSADFGQAYGVALVDGPLKGLLARAVVVVDEAGKVVHTELVPEIAQEPDYNAALAVL